jgi:hypothetical protein
MPRELHVHSVPTWGEKLRIGVEVVAIVAAGLWALYTFVYEQRIKPLGEAPSFSVPTSVEQGPTVNGVAFLTVHKGLQNTGNVPIDLAAETLSVYGEALAKRRGLIVLDELPARGEIRADVPRRSETLLYSTVKLRSAAVGGGNTDFVVPPHSSLEETYLIAVPAQAYPVVLVTRKDYVVKASPAAKVPIRILRARFGGYDLQSPVTQGEYDSQYEFPIRP